MTDRSDMDTYRKLASDLLDYLHTCASRHIAPLKRDADLYTKRLHQIEREEKRRSGRID